MENKYLNYIKDNKGAERHYYTGLEEKTIEQKYQYLKNHYEYYTMNSWNLLKSYANNVKLYNLGITDKQWDAYFKIQEIDYDYIWMQLEYLFDEFQTLTKARVFFNGRSDGYLVLAPENSNESILAELNIDEYYMENCNTYTEYKQEVNKYYYDVNQSRKEEIEYAYYVLKAFDKFCDVVRSELIYILDNYKVVTEEITETREIKYVEV